MKIKALLLSAVCAVSINISHAAIELSVSGGIGTPLTIDIVQGDTFTSINSNSGDFGLLFKDFWNNTQSSFDNTSTTNTLTMTTATGPYSTGAFIGFGFTANDLVLGFTGTTINIGEMLTLGPGTRTTTNNLSLDYTSVNPTGDVLIFGDTFNVVSDTLTWTAVPEPATTATLFGLGMLGLVIWRRTKRAA